MKQGIHPANYRPVVFRDAAVGTTFLMRSTIATDRTISWTDGQTYPLVDLDISSASHPFYTGQTRLLDTQGRIEKFERRYGMKSAAGIAAKTAAD